MALIVRKDCERCGKEYEACHEGMANEIWDHYCPTCDKLLDQTKQSEYEQRFEAWWTELSKDQNVVKKIARLIFNLTNGK